MNNAIEVTNLSKKYKGFSLKELNFVIPNGEITGFVGQNGAGKTTTIKAILNLIKYDSGCIHIFGQDHKKDEHIYKEDLAVVFDEIPFDDNLNATEISSIMQYIFKKWSKKQFMAYLTQFDLPNKKKISKYSKGMKMKLSLAVALSHDAKLLILDEPTSGLDPIFRLEILDELKTFVKDGEHAVLFSTHITGDIERIADNVLFIHKGEIVFNKRLDELMDDTLVIETDSEKHSDKKLTIDDVMRLYIEKV